jgi:2-dehydro-3-deoxyphosphogluconate aldolase / (4S)-4-hydroxy-2-oxoglutarate aldolase
MTTFEQIKTHRVVAILRGCDPDHILPIIEALYAGGIRLLEITLNSRDALGAITAAAKQYGDQLVVGAGTALTPDEAAAAIDAGARFILSPSLDTLTIKKTKQLGACSIPGAFTATEILTAWRSGADMVKVFPASIGPAYFRDLQGPLPHIPLMPTGGVNLENIRMFAKAGAAAFGIGTALVSRTEQLTANYLQQLTSSAAAYMAAIA